MLSRRWTVATAAVLALLVVPIVWLIGYQDHPWRLPELAIGSGLVAIVAGIAVHVAGRREEPPVSSVLTLAAIVMSVGAFGSTLWWVWIG